MKWSKEQTDFLINTYEKYGYKKCFEKFGITRQQIMSKVQNLKLKCRKKINVDSNQFISCLTPESVYLLGFLWADGHIASKYYSVYLQINIDDACIIRNILKTTGTWKEHHKIYIDNPTWKDSITFYTACKELHQYLLKHNFSSDDKNPNKLLKNIPCPLIHYWFRGYFDGDGCLYYNKRQYLRQLSIASKVNQDWNFIKQLFEQLGINKYEIKENKYTTKTNKTHKSSCVRCVNKDGIIKFCNYIYQGKQFGLKRKYDKYLQIVE